MFRRPFRRSVITVLSVLSVVISSCSPIQTDSVTNPSASPASISPSSPVLNLDSLELICEDDFSSVTWSTVPGNFMTEEYQKGEYVLKCSSNGSYWIKAPHSVQPNGVAEIDARVVVGGNDTAYGLCVRAGDTSFYSLDISGNSFSVQKYAKDAWIALRPSKQSTAIKTNGSANRLKLAYAGNVIDAYINGRLVATVQDDSLTDGSVGLRIQGKGSVIAFDNFKLYRFTDAYLTAISTPSPNLSQYTNLKYRYSLRYPETWKASEITPELVTVGNGEATLTVSVSDAQGKASDVIANEQKLELVRDYPDYKEVSDEKITLSSGGAATVLTYQITGKGESSPHTEMRIITIVGSYCVSATGSSNNDTNLARNGAALGKITDSLSFFIK